MTDASEPEGAPAPAEQEAAAVKEVPDEQLKSEMLALLEKADLNTTSEKQLRKQLEAKLGVDLTPNKAFLRATVEEFLATQHGDDEDGDGEVEAAEEEEAEEEVEEQPKPKRRGKGSALGSVLSPEMQEFLGEKTLPRPQVVKRIWDYIKANNLQNPKDKRKIVLDDKLKKLFKPPITMFNMNKQLSKHCKTSEGVKRSRADSEDEDDDDESEESEASENSDADSDGERKSKKAKKAKRAKTEGVKRSGGGGGFTVAVEVSAELREFLGVDGPINRPQITKAFHEYFKTNNLKDPKDKRMVLCDDRLKSLLGVDTFQAFSIQKYLKDHINPKK